MPEEEKKPRKKIVVEEVKDKPSEAQTIEVPPQTQPHVEPGIHEQKKVEPVVPPPAPISQPGLNPLLIIFPGIFLLGALLGGIIYYQKNNIVPMSTPNPILTPEPTAQSQSPSPKAEIDVEKYKIKILNGSGIAGEAGKAKSLLEKAGFIISTTGNASSYNYTKTIIQTKSEVGQDFVTAVVAALSVAYEVDSKPQSLQPSASDEVIVIIGSSKK